MDSVSQGAIGSCTFNNVTNDHAISASFVSAYSSPGIVGGIDASAQGTNLCAGSQLILTLTNVTGTAPLYYQWQTNGAAIADATRASYTNSSVSSGWDYTVVVSNACGMVTSEVATVTVNANPAITESSPLPAATYGESYSHTVAATGAAGYSAADLPAGLNIDGGSGLISGTPAVTGVSNVVVTVTNATGCSESKTLSLTVHKATPTAALAVNNSPVTYDGTPKSATVGITSNSVPGSVHNISTGGAASQTGAGNYAVTADFVPDDTANYNSLTGLGAGQFVISRATPTATLAVNNSPVLYDGNPHSAVVGVSSSSTPGSVANVSGGANKTVVGVYPVTVDFVPDDAVNFSSLTGLSAGDFVIYTTGPARIFPPTNGVVTMQFYGVPNSKYIMETTTDLSSSWQPMSTNTAGLDGSWLFTDQDATNSAKFYRTVPQP